MSQQLEVLEGSKQAAKLKAERRASQIDRAIALHRSEPELTNRDIAERVGARPHTVNRWIQNARKGR